MNFTFDGTLVFLLNAAYTADAGDVGDSICTATTPSLPTDDTTPIKIR